jgi:DNA-binding transcriptional regulator YiaG
MTNDRTVLDAAMEATGLSARGLAALVGVDERTMRRWRQGHVPAPEPVLRLCRLLMAQPSLALLLGD